MGAAAERATARAGRNLASYFTLGRVSSIILKRPLRARRQRGSAQTAVPSYPTAQESRSKAISTSGRLLYRRKITWILMSPTTNVTLPLVRAYSTAARESVLRLSSSLTRSLALIFLAGGIVLPGFFCHMCLLMECNLAIASSDDIPNKNKSTSEPWNASSLPLSACVRLRSTEPPATNTCTTR